MDLLLKVMGGPFSWFCHSIDLCYRIAKGNLMSQIKKNLSHLNVEN